MPPSCRRIALGLAVVSLAYAVRGNAQEATAPVEAAPVEPAPAPIATPAPAPAPVVVVVAPAPAPEAKVDFPRPSYKLCIAMGGAAVGALIIGGVLGGVAKSREDEQNGSVASPTLYTAELQDRGKQGSTIAIAGYVFIGIGAALAVADVVLWIERLRPVPRKKDKQQARLDLPTATTVSAGPAGLRVTF